ncbi:hypothetical protein ERO13_A01G150718v2 [Gossypium hirsutum]|uniref:Bet v I/Major latex protein domain-containing protein n=4 Tax=Gossypium TaxID=3633 RepID=A0ABR0QU05_GOSAR|nr:hypothetical protein ES319_A01G161100v1 [Gossypium barbadense]KAG4215019.1 hypothetical protein ERO13_A01G150718v2 [Gossypium hirsutum]KAK5842481.1 hypothetical protein PVK06_004845 [Gossypium arboreum]TYI43613.1 hypothetical protein ES332_A01G181700v1 [Gossypium tomentosum]TYJ49869.1 hypothetical protein E1A91_A01G165400v1 [Gossypium mustelinum]
MIVSLVDPINHSVNYGLIEGDLKNEFSSFTAKFEAEDCKVGLSVVYVKLNEDVAPPQSLFDEGIQRIKLIKIGAYLAQA